MMNSLPLTQFSQLLLCVCGCWWLTANG